MARTYRRKHYTPNWVTTDTYEFTDPRTGAHVWAGRIELDGAERAKQLRWWHEDKSCWWGARPPKPYRQEIETQHRMDAKRELTRWWRNPDYEVQVRRKKRLGYWD